MTVSGILVSGAGNRFVLLDARELPPIASAHELARRLCADVHEEWSGERADGFVRVLERPARREAQGEVELEVKEARALEHALGAAGADPEHAGGGRDDVVGNVVGVRQGGSLVDKIQVANAHP